jgi:hypothetical protein
VGRKERPGRHLRQGERESVPRPETVCWAEQGLEGREGARARRAAGPRDYGGNLGRRGSWTRGRSQAAEQRLGPQWAQAERAQRDAATSLDRGAAGDLARARPSPPPAAVWPGAGKGAWTAEPGRPHPALTGPRSRCRYQGCAASSMVPLHRGRPVPPPAPHRSTPHARRQRRRLRPGHSRGHAPSRLGARSELKGGGLSAVSANQSPFSGPLLQDWRASRPTGSQQKRGASAPGGGGLRRRWLLPLVLRPRSGMRLWLESLSTWKGGDILG